MRKIYATGETVFDIMFRDGRPFGGNPGGSVLNSVVTLGRLGLRPVFMSDYCDDMIGQEIRGFLMDNNIEPRQVISDTSKQTSVAMAFLDSDNNARYEFYKQRPQKADLSLFSAPFVSDDIMLFGSFYGIMPEIRDGVRNLVEQAHKAGAIVVYDPNFRRPHLKDLDRVLPFIEENIRLADIVKGSDEDFSLIFGTQGHDDTFGRLRGINPGAWLFYTMGKNGCAYSCGGNTGVVPVPSISTVSTIGAGDNFNAGIVYGLCRLGITKGTIAAGVDESAIHDIIDYAVKFSQHVCMSHENYISREFASSFLAQKS
ncbi:MAG: carbohydrate kinase [Bacteroidales bacterium]|nr:carbohydrate kinase [Bacteroidales bacterium]